MLMKTHKKEYNGYPRKYIKKLFRRPQNARCKKCHSPMLLLSEEECKEKVIFKCASSRCGNVLDVSFYGGREKLRIKKSLKRDVPISLKSNLPTSLTMVNYRIKNEFYKIDDKTYYNPITREKSIDSVKTNVSDEEHKELRDKIIALLKDVQ